MRSLRLILLFLRNSLQVEMEYRANLLASLLTAVFSAALAILTLLGIFARTTEIGGWDLPRMITLVGVSMIIEGLIDCWLYPSLNAITEYVRQGELDLLLIRPINSQLMVSFRNIRIWFAGNIVLGIIAILYGMQVQHVLTFGHLALSFLLIAAGVAVLYSIWLAAATLAFWFTKVGEVSIIAYTLMETGRFPVTAYPAWARFTLTYILPIAFITNVPAEAAMGRLDWLGAMLGFCAAAVALVLGNLFWRFGLSRYSSASS
ncbi:MAG TPA: ABC-2 family transporter protein [Dongiaceae bacterium]|nr:ABC-2 family transporter protein [Dongiaceae bacterium]